MENLAYAVLIASRKLRPYFETHTIEVRSNYPLKKLLHRLDLVEHLTEWAVQLNAYDIEYTSRLALKAQALAVFVAELTSTVPIEDEEKEERKVWG